MTNYWAIVIGVNQYQLFQPLNYAQRDAQELCDFLVREAGFSANQCLLLTDATLANRASPGYPSRENIQATLTQCQQHLQPGDVLWCFLSGYGIQFEGQDYLMPIEGDLTRVAETGISIDFLFNLFQSAPTDNIVLVLDVNRSQSTLVGQGVGAQTALLAQEFGIAALLSCAPHQFSHETLALRQGLFTAALIEAMRYHGCVTLDLLVQYLTDRLPELSEHHWRPRQDLFAVIPPAQKHLLIIPEQASTFLAGSALTRSATQPLGSQFLAQTEERFADRTAVATLERSFAADNSFFPQSPFSQPTSQATSSHSKNATLTFSSADGMGAVMGSNLPAETNFADRAVELIPPEFTEAEDDARFWKGLLQWGAIVGAVLLVGVMLRNGGTFVKPAPSAPVVSPPPQPTQGNAPPAAVPSPVTEAPPLPEVDLAAVMGAAQSSLDSQQSEAAKRELDQVPATQRTPEYMTLLEQVNRELLNEAKTQLIRAREVTAENQASDFVEAIKKARQIKPDQPLHLEAQENIDRWSRVIMDMAQGRAERPNDSSATVAADNYRTAITTARYVPNDRPKIHEQAQQAIAIWSQMILDIANAKASAGELDLAIQIGELVPPETPVYPSAQEAIASWRNQPAPEPPPEQPDEIL